MRAQWIKALKRRGAAPQGRPAGFTLIALLVAIATIVLVATTPAWAQGPAEPDSLAQALAAIHECMAKSPAPWPQMWQEEYLETVRRVAVAHQDSPEYAARLEILRQGFAPYWEEVPKSNQRSLFEVRQAEIRWYCENLMTGPCPSADDRRKLHDQYKGLVEYAADALLTQFSFLDPNRVRIAKADYLAKCDRDIEVPLLPILQHPLSEEQFAQLKERWTSLRYARVDLWRQLGSGSATTAKTKAAAAGKTHPDYVLTQRSLDQLRGQTWSLIAGFPDYYQDAVAKEIAAQKQRLQGQSEARGREQRLGVAIWQTEYLSFLLAALLETAQIPEEGSK